MTPWWGGGGNPLRLKHTQTKWSLYCKLREDPKPFLERKISIVPFHNFTSSDHALYRTTFLPLEVFKTLPTVASGDVHLSCVYNESVVYVLLPSIRRRVVYITSKKGTLYTRNMDLYVISIIPRTYLTLSGTVYYY